MTYHLGVDLGTTITTAAVARGGTVGVATLGEHSAAMPSVLFWGAEGPPLIGDAAVRAAAQDPTRAARELRPRLADPTPLSLGGAPFAASALLGAMLRRVVDRVAEREGGAPDGIVLTHPVSWGPAERDAFAGVAVSLGLGAVSLVSEPEAAAAQYAAREGLRDGATVAVVDLGSGSVDATVLAHQAGAFAVLGRPEAAPYPTGTAPTADAAVAGLHRALASAQRHPGDLDAVVLVGWSTRTGSIAAELADGIGQAVALEDDPEHTIARGAARLAARGAQNGATTAVPLPRTQLVAGAARRGPRATRATTGPASLPSPLPASVPTPMPTSQPTSQPISRPTTMPAPVPGRPARRWATAHRGLAAVLAVGAIVLGGVGGGALALTGAAAPASASPVPVAEATPAAPVAPETSTPTVTESGPTTASPAVAPVAEQSTVSTATERPRTRPTAPRASSGSGGGSSTSTGGSGSGHHEGTTDHQDTDGTTDTHGSGSGSGSTTPEGSSQPASPSSGS